ncbi:site-specific integrase [Mariniflexile ostreae]|uniref:Site-specific integrase n=1 Tax=Mariniflexile ostreae TaxID=1520892 RepID=A0ABV5FB78_9FLAO
MIRATIKLMLDGKPMANGKYAVYLRILKDRKQKKISLGLYCNVEHFVNESFTKHHPSYQTENEVLLNLKARALKIIREFKLNQTDFTLEDFEEAFRGTKKQDEIYVIGFFNEIIDEMTRSGRISNGKAYQSTRDSIIKFSGKKIKFKEMTTTFLEKYEVFLRENGNQNGGIVFKMKELKALFNKARKRGLIPKEPYPFENYQISKLKSNISKRALTIEEFKKIRDVDLSDYPHLVEAHNYFMFSVYARGMNFKDMMHLKWSDIQNNRIHYTRAKTKGKFNLEIIDNAQEIINYYRGQKRPTNYVFPILLHENLTPMQIHYRKQKVLRAYNLRLKEIAKLVGVETRLTSYVARHSFATILKMSGTPIEKISEMMGHADVSITMSYLKEFSNEDLDSENRKFMDL